MGVRKRPPHRQGRGDSRRLARQLQRHKPHVGILRRARRRPGPRGVRAGGGPFDPKRRLVDLLGRRRRLEQRAARLGGVVDRRGVQDRQARRQRELRSRAVARRPGFPRGLRSLDGCRTGAKRLPGRALQAISATLAEMARDLRACIEPSVSATSPTSSTFPTQRCPPLTVLPADPADDSMSDCAEGPAGILPLKRIG